MYRTCPGGSDRLSISQKVRRGVSVSGRKMTIHVDVEALIANTSFKYFKTEECIEFTTPVSATTCTIDDQLRSLSGQTWRDEVRYLSLSLLKRDSRYQEFADQDLGKWQKGKAKYTSIGNELHSESMPRIDSGEAIKRSHLYWTGQKHQSVPASTTSVRLLSA